MAFLEKQSNTRRRNQYCKKKISKIPGKVQYNASLKNLYKVGEYKTVKYKHLGKWSQTCKGSG